MNRSGASPLDANELLMSLLATVQDFTNYFDAITEDRRAHPRDDVASVIANGQINGEMLTERARHGLLHHRRDGRPRHDLQHHRRRHVGAGRATRTSSPSSRPTRA